MAGNILIVDDIPENIEAFSSVLDTYLPDLRKVKALSGAEALKKASEDPPDIVLLDVHMPEMDGFEVCRQLKLLDKTANTPVLMVSAFMTKGHHRALGLDVGADGYLCKPFDTAELVSQVRALLRLKSNEDKLREHQNQLEEELEKRTRHLRISQEHWRNLFEHSPDAVFIEDLDGNVLEANPAACEMHEMGHEELIGKNARDLVPPGQQQRVTETHPDLQENSPWEYRGFSYTKTGQAIPVEVRATRFEYQGNPAQLLHVRDVSERIRMEQELTQAQKLESVGILAGGIAHDFNNLLTGILGNISFAKLELDKDDPGYGPIREAEKSAFRARLLTQQLLTFSKGGTPVRKTASVAQLLREAANFVLSGSRSTCQFDIEDDLKPADIDIGQISQVIENLVINASQAMPYGGTIHVTGRNLELNAPRKTVTQQLEPGRYIEIVVRDEGIGISEENLTRVFDPYFTTKKGGSGLGLATSYSIINKHDGVISVESDVNHGTTFTILIPASDRPLPEAPVIGNTPMSGEGHILVMDDEFVIRDVIEAALDKLGYSVVTVADGRAAIDAYQSAMQDGKPFDAVILDITVPGGMGGEEAVELLKAIDPDVKAIVSSGYSTGRAMSAPETLGFAGVIAKPYSIQQLSYVLHSVLHPEKQ